MGKVKTDNGVKPSYAELETENRLIRAQLEQRDQRVIHLAEQRDQEIRSRVAAEASAKDANAKARETAENNAHLKDILLQAQLDVARLEGHRDRQRELDLLAYKRARQVAGVDLAGGPDYSATWRPGNDHRDWVNRT